MQSRLRSSNKFTREEEVTTWKLAEGILPDEKWVHPPCASGSTIYFRRAWGPGLEVEEWLKASEMLGWPGPLSYPSNAAAPLVPSNLLSLPLLPNNCSPEEMGGEAPSLRTPWRSGERWRTSRMGVKWKCTCWTVGTSAPLIFFGLSCTSFITIKINLQKEFDLNARCKVPT